MIVGTEWIVDAFDCDAEFLRDLPLLQSVFARIIKDLKLKVVKETWHRFEGEQGITGLALLTESHLACHTYPEHGIATFNLYCCRTRREWDWAGYLKSALAASGVNITRVERGESEFRVSNLKSQIAGGRE